uniref:AlNc14C163G7810 protein n=1 Tax=Albugo laibachii Nc14 TaxID=890382 RepID=F0WMX4_9STRA|nr:AlNc14C163G7810 [Albugo laibachii Nc14]|eukprot:CCA22660.1 AlNc14C163G7810 [Albugo laibachii Nc14]
MGLEVDFPNGERRLYDKSLSLSVRVDSRGLKILWSMSTAQYGAEVQPLEGGMLLIRCNAKVTSDLLHQVCTSLKHEVVHASTSEPDRSSDSRKLSLRRCRQPRFRKNCPLYGSISEDDDVVPTGHPSYGLSTASGRVVPVFTVYGNRGTHHTFRSRRGEGCGPKRDLQEQKKIDHQTLKKCYRCGKVGHVKATCSYRKKQIQQEDLTLRLEAVQQRQRAIASSIVDQVDIW